MKVFNFESLLASRSGSLRGNFFVLLPLLVTKKFAIHNIRIWNCSATFWKTNNGGKTLIFNQGYLIKINYFIALYKFTIYEKTAKVNPTGKIFRCPFQIIISGIYHFIKKSLKNNSFYQARVNWICVKFIKVGHLIVQKN